VISHQPQRSGRAMRTGLVLLALASVGLGLSQCRSVTDPAIEMSKGRSEPLDARHKECTKRCDQEHKEAKADELDLHKRVIRACGGDLACRKYEHDRYRDAKKAIEGRKKACKFLCRYNEGAVSGGK